MSSLVDMSLEDIIQKKKETIRKGKPHVNKKIQSNIIAHQKNTKVQPKPGKRPVIVDARNKIILKKRTQITDAREKLAELAKQKDARLKLEQMRLKRAALTKGLQRNKLFEARSRQGTNKKWTRTIPNNDSMFTDPSRQIISQPLRDGNRLTTNLRSDIKKFKESRSIESRRLDNRPIKPIVRTVENDIILMEEDEAMSDDNLDIHRPISMNRMATLNLKIVTHNRDARDRIKERSPSIRPSTVIREQSPPRPPSILKKRPMAAMRSERKPETKQPPAEYRIIVSNLRSSVTGGDIEELFGDVGGMVESRLVRPGTAEVIYKTHEDAQKAVDLYHNRQLDGQAMNCLLVAPRSAPIPRDTSGSKPSLPASSHSNVEPDLSTFHKVLFNSY